MTVKGSRQSVGPMTLAFRRIRNAIRPRVKVYKMPPGIHTDWNVPVIVRDGTTLRVNVFRPEGGAPAPVIISAHPYGKDAIPARTRSGRGLNLQYRLFPQPHPIEISEWTSWEAPDPGVWVPRGYAVVNVDLRGGGTAEGIGDLFSDQEALDFHDVIEWAGTQSWSSGRVGLNGVSYLAISEYKVAALRPPHLAAICPWEGFSDLYRDFARPGGVREDGFTIVWDKGLKRGGVRTNTEFRKEIASRPERDEALSSPSQPVHRHRISEPLRAGEIVPVDIALQPHATRFLKGDVLRLDIRGTWHFPKDPLRGQFPSGYEGSAKAVCVLHTGGPFDAWLLAGTRPVSMTAAKSTTPPEPSAQACGYG
ncbi:CocE/NonD family hydrolase [Paraburkholderia gardini]|uniref:CocE/NonD family hydrolase n=1 Tax=Paraburkholderia gardini TaxID=2823469 RepID=A0ABM8U8C4_9BURK|nr:CocE/NonD family hydrolase [Paraburkholderia gardini]CAG4915416.1 hypothetical protein R54767_04196 [Paraburkholderia gardini]